MARQCTAWGLLVVCSAACRPVAPSHVAPPAVAQSTPIATRADALDASTAPAAADAAAVVHAIADASPPGVNPTPALVERCGVRGLRVEAVRPLDRAAFAREQREARGARAFRAPAVLGWAPPEASSGRLGAVLLGDARDASCRALVDCSESNVVHGPFAGIAGSDARWTARVFCGVRWVVGLVDEGGTPRVLRDLGYAFNPDDEYSGAGMGVSLRALEAFDAGRSVVVSTYETADGSSDYTLRVYSVVNDELRELFRETRTHTMGAPHEYELRARGPRSPAPSIEVSFRTGSVDDDADPPTAVFRAPHRWRVFRYDPARQRFAR